MTNKPNTELACDLGGFSAAEREHHVADGRALFARVQAIRELAHGYAFQIPSDAATLLQAARFVADERRCCPFFGFALELEPHGGPLWVTLSGGTGVKEFIQKAMTHIVVVPQAKKRVLVLCTANSARSQMAEGVLRWLAPERYEVFSAGSRATYLNPYAVQAMTELGVDISGHTSKTFEQFLGQPFDAVITVCDNAAELPVLARPVPPHALELSRPGCGGR
jgi:hypothetical protein